jgi:formate/nitrite transporter FocA (FNT family)
MVCLAVFVAQMSSDVISKVVGVYFVLSAFGESKGVALAVHGYKADRDRANSHLSIRARCRRHVCHPLVSIFLIACAVKTSRLTQNHIYRGMMLDKNPTVARYIWKDVIGALVGNIVGAWMIGLSLWWIYLFHVSRHSISATNSFDLIFACFAT